MNLLELIPAMLGHSWLFLVESAPWLLFGFAAAGMIHAFVSADFVASHLGRGRFGPVVKAAVLGVPLPLCSCGVLPAALGLRKKGATKGATLSFLISTPETGVDSIAFTYAIMDPIMTVFRPLAALVTAIFAGVMETIFGQESQPEAIAPAADCGCSDTPVDSKLPVPARIKGGLRFAFGELLGELAPWLAAGILAAGAISALIPDGFIEQYLGGGWLSLLLMLAIGIPMYICASASTPIAAALLLKGLSPGAALVFLLAGPATNIASITALASTLGVAATTRYLFSICLGALGMGWALDMLYAALGADATALAGVHAETMDPALGITAALALIGLAVVARWPKPGRHKGCAQPGSS